MGAAARNLLQQQPSQTEGQCGRSCPADVQICQHSQHPRQQECSASRDPLPSSCSITHSLMHSLNSLTDVYIRPCCRPLNTGLLPSLIPTTDTGPAQPHSPPACRKRTRPPPHTLPYACWRQALLRPQVDSDTAKSIVPPIPVAMVVPCTVAEQTASPTLENSNTNHCWTTVWQQGAGKHPRCK